MSKFDVHILGCGSALPTTRHFSSSQVVNFRDKLFMIDCGEGTQMQLRKSRLKFSRLNHIFISHLHGDHCFGLMGLISTFGLLGRTATLYIHAPKELIPLMTPQLDFFCGKMSYSVIISPINTSKQEIVYEDRGLTVTTIPLKHRMPCCGFLFQEKPKPRHILREWTDFFQVPISEFNKLKNGADFYTADGTCVPNSKLTKEAEPVKSYAYCSDTIYKPDIVEQIKGVDVLFHEATFSESEAARAQKTFHSTAKQAAMIAKAAEVKKLVIGHFSARYEDESILLREAKTVFKPTILAKENISISL